ncbi:hypothetical protein FUA23_13535 [Neolewinella aurantiaca]|uniref:Uncharacterized protein n=1 Tax=Neolewinella aurantiaca TaxID=2602767 RepID=A0A5C7FCJ3_9BACT|nr:hypothetical protein [Neolewinella aurantiaca]TXF88683.1 hypothetical protein FUA23_13535 [Neolewinella aurantiaca]
MIHDDKIPHYGKDWSTLAEALGDLRYDVLADFLSELSKKLAKDADADAGRGRHKLSEELYTTASKLEASANATERAWEICAPFMDEDLID